MNNLIIGTPRSGTFNLYNSIVENPGNSGISEPFFNYFDRGHATYSEFKKELPNLIDKSNNNFTIKTISVQYPKDVSVESSLEFYEDLISYFDNIIFIDRRDMKSHFESWCNLVNKIKRFGGNKVNNKYVFNSNKVDLNNLDLFFKIKHQFLRIVEKFNGSIFYYEDLYFDKQEETYKQMNLEYTEVAKEYLNPSRKYRQDNTNSILI